MDATIGMLLAKLEALGIAERTYFIYTADHGAQGRNANAPLSNGKGTVWEGGIRVPLIVRGPGIKAGACTHTFASTVDFLPTIAGLARVKEALPKNLEGGNLLGNLKLIRPYETGTLLLFDLSKDAGENHDLAKENAKETAELDRRLSEYLKAVGARMPAPNVAFDPAKAKPFEERRGGRKKRAGSRAVRATHIIIAAALNAPLVLRYKNLPHRAETRWGKSF